MIIGGIQKNSLIDFPSKISCVLFTAGCNFHCPYCHNPELVRPPFTHLHLEGLFDFLENRKALLDGVVITGGEPTLHRDLPEFCDRIKHLGFAIKLDTNGSHPEILRTLIKSGRIDYIAMDIKTLPENYFPHISQDTPVKSFYETIRIIKSSGIGHEFRTTCAPPFVDAKIIESIARIIKGADLFVLQKAELDPSILNPAFFESYDQFFDTRDLTHFQQIAAPFLKKILVR